MRGIQLNGDTIVPLQHQSANSPITVNAWKMRSMDGTFWVANMFLVSGALRAEDRPPTKTREVSRDVPCPEKSFHKKGKSFPLPRTNRVRRVVRASSSTRAATDTCQYRAERKRTPLIGRFRAASYRPATGGMVDENSRALRRSPPKQRRSSGARQDLR